MAPGSRQETVRVGELLRAWKVSGSTSALSPPFVNAGVRFLAPFPGKGGVVGIPFGAAAIVGGRIFGVKGGARAKPFRQVWIGQKLAPKGDQIRLALPEPCVGRLLVETAGDDERTAVSFAHQF